MPGDRASDDECELVDGLAPARDDATDAQGIRVGDGRNRVAGQTELEAGGPCCIDHPAVPAPPGVGDAGDRLPRGGGEIRPSLRQLPGERRIVEDRQVVVGKGVEPDLVAAFGSQGTDLLPTKACGLGIGSEARSEQVGQRVARVGFDELDVGDDLPQFPLIGLDTAGPGWDEAAQLGFVDEPGDEGPLDPVPPEGQRPVEGRTAEEEGGRCTDPVEDRLGDREMVQEVVIEADRHGDRLPPAPARNSLEQPRDGDQAVVAVEVADLRFEEVRIERVIERIVRTGITDPVEGDRQAALHPGSPEPQLHGHRRRAPDTALEVRCKCGLFHPGGTVSETHPPGVVATGNARVAVVASRAVIRTRPLESADLDEVAVLLKARLPGGPWREDTFLRRSLVDSPEADPELPSLVAIGADGRIVGFIAAQARNYMLRDRPVRGVLCSHLVVASEQAGTAAALLLRGLLSGPQDFTFTDTAIDPVARAWQRLGGIPDPGRSTDWMLSLGPGRFALRPFHSARAAARAKAAGEEAWRRIVPIAALPLQAAGPAVVSSAYPEPEQDVDDRVASAAEIAAGAAAFSRGTALRPDHGEAALAHAFDLIERTTGNPLVRRMVFRAGTPVGWYAYEQRPDRTARALLLDAPERESDAVLANLVATAQAAGNAILFGRTEPHLIEPLGRRLPALGFARRPLLHSRDADVALLLTTPASRLSLLDGEWWA